MQERFCEELAVAVRDGGAQTSGLGFNTQGTPWPLQRFPISQLPHLLKKI